MVLSKAELISATQNEVRILLHLAGKIDPAQQDYRPTPKQRSTIELLRYLTVMGPGLVSSAKAAAFDEAAWTAAEQKAATMSLEQVKAALAGHADWYASEIGAMSEGDFRGEIAMFGPPMSRGAWIVFWLLGSCAAYRTQLFLYLKACGREELNTMNLWAGMDGSMG
jgi:hypothetical protein